MSETTTAGETVKYVLDESRLPEAWYNLAADLPSPPPPVLHPGTGQPVGPDDLAPLFPMEIILQEVSTERQIEIPERGPRRLPPVAAHAPLPGAPTGGGARDARAHLLQIRGRLARPGVTSRTPPSRRPSTTSARA